ncbi:hypothetical protein UABAM_03516 [Candidatus Uabimicrobium amorphum]|uniref:Uncharacterized protein n=1 Tax=Uabimicrobium amorphum TaxID=2596890 RepID=A0A5S9INH2_UABAM|nr:hypothetical protein UABAM_03516 [Candidatus Uabimicrobium amorphum]
MESLRMCVYKFLFCTLCTFILFIISFYQDNFTTMSLFVIFILLSSRYFFIFLIVFFTEWGYEEKMN